MMPENISIQIDGDKVQIDRGGYELLFENSSVYNYKKYKDSLLAGKINFRDLVTLSRQADIPYTIFFASQNFIKKCVDEKNSKLLAGVSKKNFSVNSRGNVEIRDIELIIKDILNKQALVKKYNVGLLNNPVVGLLRGSRESIPGQAHYLRDYLGIDLELMHGMTKTKAYEYLVSILEQNNIYVSQSSRSFMPQTIRNEVKFSGLCIKDKKVPFIFLNNKDETSSYEPEGRRVFTLALLVICIAKGKFCPVSYNEQSKNLISKGEFILAEELLMPKESFIGELVHDLEDIKKLSKTYCVTPSAIIMRLRRLLIINYSQVTEFMDLLRDEFASAPRPTGRTPRPEKGFMKYNGHAFSELMIQLVQNGTVGSKDATRILFKNKRSIRFLEEYGASL